MNKFTSYLDTTKEIEIDGMIIQSPLVAVLQEARKMTGRDEKTGKKVKNVSHGSWLGSVGYMITIDQIGDKFYLPDREDGIKEISGVLSRSIENVCSFVKALANFSHLSNEEIFALYALRCSFVHDYFLYNIGNKHFTHHFIVTQGEENIVILPEENWDGDLKNRTDKNKTTISLEALGDLVEEIHKKLLELSTDGKLNIKPGAMLESVTYKKR